SENRIKELRQDFGLNSFALNEFYATEAALTVAMMAYNLMAVFRLFVMKSEVQHTLSTLRFKTFAIGAYFQKIRGKTVLKIALAKQRRKWFEGLWNSSNQVQAPLKFSIA
ncbi:MAG: transposase, partial [Bacteroidota bacterium]